MGHPTDTSALGFPAQDRAVGGARSSPPAAAGRSRPGDGVLATVCGGLAWLVSALGSWIPSLWTDEAATISGARRSLPELWTMLQHVDAVHGLHYLLMHFWIGIFGQSALALRMPSALAVGIGAAGVFWLARHLGGPGLGVVSALVFAILPRVAWAGIEARSFAFSAAAAVWLSVLLMVALRRRKPWCWGAYSLLSAVSIGINLYLVLVLTSHALTVLALRAVGWRTRFAWLASAGTGVLLASPVIYLSMAQSRQISDQELGWLRWLRNVAVNQWFLGDTPTDAPGQFAPGWLWKLAAVALAGACWLIMSFALVKILGSRAPGVRRTYLAWLLPQIVLPTAAIGLYSLYVHPMYNPRYLSFSAPAVAIAIGAGVWFLRRHWLRTAAVLGILALAAPVYVSQRQVYAKRGFDWSVAAAYVQDHKGQGDGVYFSPRYPPAGSGVGLTLRRVGVAYPEAFAGLRDLTLATPGARNGTLDGTSRLLADSVNALGTISRIWVVRRLDYPQDDATAEDAQFLAAGYHAKIAWTGPLDSIIEFSR
ncbi:glycosyltransferase family 39 protein [Pseudarthrobacter sp. P1]|uniref:glycosyltransferase family 39 protein n=1 Tax=Pseudarthrobacter sp. P1 TaxID=3418418 RepID=UPI003CED0E93